MSFSGDKSVAKKKKGRYRLALHVHLLELIESDIMLAEARREEKQVYWDDHIEEALKDAVMTFRMLRFGFGEGKITEDIKKAVETAQEELMTHGVEQDELFQYFYF